LIYTYHTAKKIVSKYKDIEFYFLIGADQLNNLKRWYKADELTKIFKFVCYKRPGYIINEELAKHYNVTIIDGPTIDISSTIIRSGIFSNIDEKVSSYIKDKQLYLKERVMPKLAEDRFIHVLSTARIAKRFASSNNVNTNQAYVAGILHDIAKGLSKDEILDIVKNHYPSKLSYPEFSYHAFASEYLAKVEFGITDKKILKAIRLHCCASKNMSKLDKIIYCADKLEETRPFAKTLNDIRTFAYDDIDKCFILVMKDQLNYLQNSNKKIDNNLVKMIQYYERKFIDGR
jgi:nicotinate-nucleotide adenylyltransferase